MPSKAMTSFHYVMHNAKTLSWFQRIKIWRGRGQICGSGRSRHWRLLPMSRTLPIRWFDVNWTAHSGTTFTNYFSFNKLDTVEKTWNILDTRRSSFFKESPKIMLGKLDPAETSPVIVRAQADLDDNVGGRSQRWRCCQSSHPRRRSRWWVLAPWFYSSTKGEWGRNIPRKWLLN